MRVVTRFGLILNMRRRDGDAALALFRSLVNLIERNNLAEELS